MCYHPSTENSKKDIFTSLNFYKDIIKHYFHLESRFIFVPFITVPVSGKNNAWSEEEHGRSLFQVHLWHRNSCMKLSNLDSTCFRTAKQRILKNQQRQLGLKYYVQTLTRYKLSLVQTVTGRQTLAGPKSGLLSHIWKWIIRGDTHAGKARDFIGKGLLGGEQQDRGTQASSATWLGVQVSWWWG